MDKQYQHKSIGVSIAGFALCLLSMIFWGLMANAQTLDNLQMQVGAVREIARDNAADLKLVNAQVTRNTADIQALTASVAELVAATNKLSGIGLTIASLGGIIFIFQSVSLVKQTRNGGASKEESNK